MTYLSRFDTDVFISYSKLDNQDEWVTKFHRQLEARLSQLLGASVTVWRDRELGATEIVTDEISRQLKKAAVLLAVVTPGYVNSEWCQRELNEFERAASLTGGLQVGSRIRVAKATKTPLLGLQHKNIYPYSLAEEFYQHGENKGEEIPDFKEFAPDDLQFTEKLNRLALRISSILFSLRKRETVYLAETSPELTPEREKILRELTVRRYRVLPKLRVGEEGERGVGGVGLAVGQSGHSIHLFGDFYHDAASSQYEEARSSGSLRIAWIVRNSQESDGLQIQFLRELRDEQQDPSGERSRLEFSEGDTIEGFKTSLLDKLEYDAKTAGTEPGEPLYIHLICHTEDHKEPDAVRLWNHLTQVENFQVEPPLAPTISALVAHRYYRNSLMLSDGILVYWGKSSLDWIEKIRQELAKIGAQRKRRPIASKAVYIAPPSTGEKESFHAHELPALRQSDSFDPAVLVTFLIQLRRFRGSRN